MVEKLNIPCFWLEEETDWQSQMAQASLIVDSLFGVGLSRAITGPWAEVMTYLNSLAVPVVAVDIPSGIEADTEVGDLALRAELTVTCGLPKWGLLMDPALGCTSANWKWWILAFPLLMQPRSQGAICSICRWQPVWHRHRDAEILTKAVMAVSSLWRAVWAWAPQPLLQKRLCAVEPGWSMSMCPHQFRPRWRLKCPKRWYFLCRNKMEK